jgi:hypothetical protein
MVREAGFSMHVDHLKLLQGIRELRAIHRAGIINWNFLNTAESYRFGSPGAY